MVVSTHLPASANKLRGSENGDYAQAESRADIFNMGKRYNHLFDKIVDRNNVWRAYRKASKGKRYSTGYLQFRQDEAANLARLSEQIKNKTYRPGEPRRFRVLEPKPRMISALPFPDRIAQHALYGIVEPIFDKVFLPQSYACRRNKGTHRAVLSVQSMLRRTPEAWILKTDFSKYFASVDRVRLHREIRRKIRCRDTLELFEVFIPTTGCGLPIGDLTSQLTANIYGHILDRWLVHDMGVTSFARYMDDVVIISPRQELLRMLQADMERFCAQEMGLRFSQWSIQPASAGVNFCGYRIWPTHKLLRRDSVATAKRKIRRYRRAGDQQTLDRFLASWRGHAHWANTFNLLNHLGVAQCTHTTPPRAN